MKYDTSLKLEILDSSLRDGAQNEAISYSVEDKLAISKLLDNIGVDFIEAGTNFTPKDIAFFSEKSEELSNAKLVCFTSTAKDIISLESDDSIKKLIDKHNIRYFSIVGKAHKTHAENILKVSPNENLSMIEKSIRFFTDNGVNVIFDAEHFFDGFRYNSDYAMDVLRAAFRGGATRLVLCDTNGATFPDDVYDITAQVVKEFNGAIIGVHCHNDTGMAVASTIMAVKAGARHIQGTFIGYGERCGNANLSTVIANLQLKLGYNIISDTQMSELTMTASHIAEISNTPLASNMPYVGKSAFAHKAGMHIDGVLKSSCSFEHVNPKVVGNDTRMLLGELSGKSAYLTKLTSLFPELTTRKDVLTKMIIDIKEMENHGYVYEAADASLFIHCGRLLGKYKSHFDLISYKVFSEQPNIDNMPATATITINCGGDKAITAAQGDGPVHALDEALRRALTSHYPTIGDMQLMDYKVRVINPEATTGAVVRVLITSKDSSRKWTTVGVSADIIEASWIALAQSIEYKLNYID